MWIMVLLMIVAAGDPRHGHEYVLHKEDGHVRTFPTVVACTEYMPVMEAEIKSKTEEPFQLQCKPYGKR